MTSSDSNSLDSKQQRGSFLGFILQRKTNKLVKADLGQKNQFYYDENSKQWIERGASLHQQTVLPLPKPNIKPHDSTAEVIFTKPTLTRTSSLTTNLSQKQGQSQFQVTSTSKFQSGLTTLYTTSKTASSNIFIANEGQQQTNEAEENYSTCGLYNSTLPIGVKRRKQSLDENQDHNFLYDETHMQKSVPFVAFLKPMASNNNIDDQTQDILRSNTNQFDIDFQDGMKNIQSVGESVGWTQDRTSKEFEEYISAMHSTDIHDQLNHVDNVDDCQTLLDGNEIVSSPQQCQAYCALLQKDSLLHENEVQVSGQSEEKWHFYQGQMTNSVGASDAYAHYMDWMNNRWYSYVASLDCEEQDRLTRDSIQYQQCFDDWVGQVYIEYYQLYPDYYDQLFVQPSKQIEPSTEGQCLTVCRSEQVVYGKQEVTIEQYPSLDSWVVKDTSPKKRARSCKEGKLNGPTPWDSEIAIKQKEHNTWVIQEEGELQEEVQLGTEKLKLYEENFLQSGLDDVFPYLVDEQFCAGFTSGRKLEQIQFDNSNKDGCCICSNGIQNPLFDLRSASFTSQNAETNDGVSEQQYTDFSLDKQQALTNEFLQDVFYTVTTPSTVVAGEELRPLTLFKQDLHSLVCQNASSSSTTPRDSSLTSQSSLRQSQSISAQQLQQIEQRLLQPSSSQQVNELQEQLRQSRIEIHSHQITIDDLFVALGQESAKVQKLRQMLLDSGIDEDEIDEVLLLVEEEVGWGKDSDNNCEIQQEKQE